VRGEKLSTTLATRLSPEMASLALHIPSPGLPFCLALNLTSIRSRARNDEFAMNFGAGRTPKWLRWGSLQRSGQRSPTSYVLRVRIKMRSGAYAPSRQDTDYAGAGGWSGVHGGRSVTRGPAVLTLVCIQADLSRCAKCKVLRAVESPLSGYNDLLGYV